MVQEGDAAEEKFRENKIVLMGLGNVPDGKEMSCAVYRPRRQTETNARQGVRV